MKPSSIILLFFFIVFSATSQKKELEYFVGTFRYGNFSTDLMIEFDRNKESEQVFFSSPEQNAYRIPAQEVFIGKDSLKFALQSDYYRYAFTGAFKGDSLSMSLEIENANYRFALARGSSDKQKLRSRDVRFRSGQLLLYGTVYFPEAPNGKAIYFVTSSGDQDRSGTRAEAQFFAKKGYITMHADKRGTGLSDGSWQESDIPELCEDDMMAITYLAETNSLNYNCIGLKGSSQGASKVPYILSKMPELGFGMVISCPASSLLESDLNYWKNRNRNSLSEDELEEAEHIQRSVFLYIAGEKSVEELKDELYKAKDEAWMSSVWVPELTSVKIDKKLNYSPIPYFEKIEQPLLVIQGSSDEVIPDQSLKTIKGITATENPKSDFILLKQADHAMMFKGNSDFPYWPSLHPEYRTAMLLWLNRLGDNTN